MKRTAFLLLALCSCLLGSGQNLDQALPAMPAPITNLQGAWDDPANAKRAEQWRAVKEAAPENATIQWNWFRSEYDALNSSNNANLSPADLGQLERMAVGIATVAPNSFEQHLARFYLEFPAAAAFAELEAARGLAPARTELISPLLSKAIRDGDAGATAQWANALEQRGGLAPALLTVAHDVLSCLPDDAVIFANGDMDVQPLVVAQVVNKVKPKVLVVDRRLLADANYRARIWLQAGASGSVPPEGPAFAQSLLRSTRRPVFFALSLDPAWLGSFPGQLHAIGAAFRVGPASPGYAAELERHWKTMRKPADAGPLSRNYLLPGAVLLGQLRQAGRTREADSVQAEIERLARATGTLSDLRKLGVLKP
ncbi:MAG TPA: hypothetical protein PKD45_11260 [Flavobacteriales bacterium]|nr:hypothetical protein [Flavobacteriales bacterium]